MTQSFTTVLARGGEVSSCTFWVNVSNYLEFQNITFIRKKVIEVRRSTVAFKSCSFSGLEAGKLFLYMERSILRLLWRVSRSLMNRSFCT